MISSYIVLCSTSVPNFRKIGEPNTQNIYNIAIAYYIVALTVIKNRHIKARRRVRPREKFEYGSASVAFDSLKTHHTLFSAPIPRGEAVELKLSIEFNRSVRRLITN